MRKLSITVVVAGAIAATFAFTAVTSQVITASSASAYQSSQGGTGNAVYWFRNPAHQNGAPRRLDFWGHTSHS